MFITCACVSPPAELFQKINSITVLNLFQRTLSRFLFCAETFRCPNELELALSSSLSHLILGLKDNNTSSFTPCTDRCIFAKWKLHFWIPRNVRYKRSEQLGPHQKGKLHRNDPPTTARPLATKRPYPLLILVRAYFVQEITRDYHGPFSPASTASSPGVPRKVFKCIYEEVE